METIQPPNPSAPTGAEPTANDWQATPLSYIREALRDSADLIDHLGGNGKLARKALAKVDEAEQEAEQELAQAVAHRDQNYRDAAANLQWFRKANKELEIAINERDSLRAELATVKAERDALLMAIKKAVGQLELGIDGMDELEIRATVCTELHAVIAGGRESDI